MLSKARHIILAIIDFFHKPVARWIPSQTFKYLFCGGTNTMLNIFIYFISYNFVLHGAEKIPVIGDFSITSRVAAWIIAFAISFPIGFTLSRHIVFPESNLQGRVQFFRYVLATVTFIVMNYVLIKFFATYAPFIWPTVSYTFVNVIIAVLSYISQRKFTFKISEEQPVAVVVVEEDIMVETVAD